MSILGVIFILVLIVAYLIFLSRYEDHLDKLNSLTASNIPSLQTRGLFRGAQKIKDNKDLSPLLLDLEQQQQDIKTDIEELDQILRPISDVIQRLDRILSGAQSKGALGEQLIEERLAQLPHDWIDKNATTGFALRAPNGKLVPIYSKWTATELLDQLGKTTDKLQQDDLKKQIRREVSVRAQESLKYLQKDRTLGFCIVAVPDSAFGLCLDVQARLTAANIVLISYSLLVPYILLIVDTFLKNAQSTQVLQVSHILNRATAQIELIQKYIDTQVKIPLDTVRLQQSQYSRNNQQLQQVNLRLTQIQNAISALQSSLPTGINPLPNTDIVSIPKTLELYLTQLQEGLLESFPRQNPPNQHSPNE